MRSLMMIAGLGASLALMLGAGPAGAQVYPPPINEPPPGYANPPPAPPAPVHRAYYRHHAYRHYRHYRRYGYAGCRYRRHRAGAIGAVAGAVGGGIIGSALTHGNPAFALVGAGAGALTGHAIGRSSPSC
jgi:hypothetical protein